MNCLLDEIQEEHAHCPECLAILDDPTGFCPEERAITERMPIKDALADAETLRMMTQEVSLRGIRTRLEAASFNCWAYFQEPCGCGCGAGTLDHLAWQASRCADQAFRAIPELRA